MCVCVLNLRFKQDGRHDAASRLTTFDLCSGGCGCGAAGESSVELVCRHELLGAESRDTETEDGEEHGRVQDESMCIVFREFPQLYSHGMEWNANERERERERIRILDI